MLRLIGHRLMLSATLAALAACNPYDPDLPSVPFLCGTDEPRCPDGYRPTQVSAVRCECHPDEGSAADAGGDEIDAGPFSCNNDSSFEPNEDILEATPTAIGASTSTIFNDMAICPGNDVDVFRMMIDQNGTTIEVTVDFDQSRGNLRLDILNSSGTSVAMGSQAGEDRLRAVTTASVQGTYYAQIRAASGDQNNYDVRMMITRP